MRYYAFLLQYLGLAALLLGFATTGQAHDPGLSIAELRVTTDQLTAHLTFARRDMETLVPIDTNQDGVIAEAEFSAAYPQLHTLAQHVLTLDIDDLPLAAQVTAVELDQSDALHMRLVFSRQAGVQLRLHAAILSTLARGHRQYAAVLDTQDTLMAERILDAEQATFAVSLGLQPALTKGRQSFVQFLLLGIEHIITGYDHLLFLFGLLVIGGSLGYACRIITSFTVAHSLTLALATFEVLQLPSRVVEPLIAASIVYIGAENLWHRAFLRRWQLTFAFGLLHGLGFASVLRDLGVSGYAALLPLLAFNSGVELGQLALALLVLPLLWQVQQLRQFFPRFTAACSLLVLLLGTYWLLERTVLP